jgi:MFS family permease
MHDAPELQRSRIAVSVIFATNGFLLAVWLPRLFQIQEQIGISDGQLGIALATGAVGGLIAGPLAAPAVSRWGSGAVAVAMVAFLAPAVPLLALAPSLLTLGAVMALFGAADAVQDAAMNAQGIRVQQRYGRSILNSFHGFWSLGTVAGALFSSASLVLQVALLPTLIIAAAASALAVVFTARWLLPAPDPHHHVGEHPTRRPWTPIILLLGLFTLLAIVIEDVPARWSSIYLNSLGAPDLLIGLSLVTFTVGMMIGRFTGDRIVDHLGSSRVVRIGMTAAAITLAAALLVGTAWAFIVACFVVGLAVATLFPAAMRAAAHQPGIRPATGVAIVSWLARAGFVVAPLVVGLVADEYGIAWGLTFPVLIALVLVVMAPVVSDRRSESR